MIRYLPINALISVLLHILIIGYEVPVYADIASIEDAKKPIVICNTYAPVTIVEFASLGCSHCADFHHVTYPKLKKDYIDQGKVKLIFTDFKFFVKMILLK